MAQANGNLTLIPSSAKPEDHQNPLDHAIHTAARQLLKLRAPRLGANPTKGDAQDVVRWLLNICQAVDTGLLNAGLEVRSTFGNGIDVGLYTDLLRSALEGNATHDICRAAELEAEERAMCLAERQRHFWRGIVRDARLEAAE